MSTVLSPETNPTTRPQPGPLTRTALAGLNALASLRLTVVLFVLSTVLVFAGTLAQVDQGIWNVVDRYFWSDLVWIPATVWVRFGQTFFNIWAETSPPSWLGFWFPGGRLLGILMVVNLTAAHIMRFRAQQTLREVRKGFAASNRTGFLTLLDVAFRRGGVWLIHSGLVLLFIGEFGTRIGQVEQRMVISEGQSVSFTSDHLLTELAFTDRSDPDSDRVIVVPEALLKQAHASKTRLTDPALPVDVSVDEWFINSVITDESGPNPATFGYGAKTFAGGVRPFVKPVKEATGLTSGESNVNVPGGYVTLYKKGTDEPLGTALITANLITAPSTLQPVPDTNVDVALRFVRYYKPFNIALQKFTVEYYPGTRNPKNYASRVQVIDPDQQVDYEITISMNQPLLHRGETFFQSGFDMQGTPTTILQVVANPVKWLPYAACVVVSAGLLMHFSYFLTQFLVRLARGGTTRTPVVANPQLASLRAPEPTRKTMLWTLLGLVVLGLMYYGGYVRRTTPQATLDLSKLGRIAVLDGGRIKPLDTFARAHLRSITHKEDVDVTGDAPRPALEWVMEIATLDAATGAKNWSIKSPVYRIENEDLRGLLDLERRKSYRYSLEELFGDTSDNKRRIELLQGAIPDADKVKPANWTKFQKMASELGQNIGFTNGVQAGALPKVLPPRPGQTEWRGLIELIEPANAMADQARQQFIRDALGRGDPKAAVERLTAQEQEDLVRATTAHRQQAYTAAVERLLADEPAARAWMNVLAAYKSKNQTKLDAAVAEFVEQQVAASPKLDISQVRTEAQMNAVAPFYHIIVGCGLVAFLIALSWGLLFSSPMTAEAVRRGAVTTLWLIFGAATLSLVLRMYLSDRPLVFVTNLYSSAVFIAAGVMLLGLIVERIAPIGLGAFTAATLGFVLNVLAHNTLAVQGDTIQMQEAVLDSNLWLSTHVTTVTAGYAATYLAGALGIMYVVLDLTTNVLKRPTVLGRGSGARQIEIGRALSMLIYGVVCFALMLSFVGTVLGGIWADQSWGRFWGWDPKENGAVLIVLWNALILHARWGGLIKDRGVALLAIAGNIITTWSYFGTNQLGVGLHAYGFSKELADGCVMVWMSHAAIMISALGMWSYERWIRPKLA